MLETVIPPVGGKVMIVEGGSKGKLGTLLERKKRFIFFLFLIISRFLLLSILTQIRSGDSENAIVQMMGDLQIETYSLDGVAQYVGTMDEEAVDMSV